MEKEAVRVEDAVEVRPRRPPGRRRSH